MRIDELTSLKPLKALKPLKHRKPFKALKTIKPLKPNDAMIASKKRGVEVAKMALDREKEFQRRQKDLAKSSKTKIGK